MIFQHTWKQVMYGVKTQTRRIKKDHERGRYGALGTINAVEHATTGRVKWAVGRDYAVQPGRGESSIMRIRITAIRLERLQEISEADAKAEGMTRSERLKFDAQQGIKSKMIVKGGGGHFLPTLSAQDCFRLLWSEIHTRVGTRWEDNPQVWVLEFELAEARTFMPLKYSMGDT